MNKKIEYFCKGIIVTGILCAVLANVQARNYERALQIQDSEIIQLENRIDELEAQNDEFQEALQFVNEWQFLGEYKITYYWPSEDQYGSMTSTGVTAQEGRTVAVDPSVIPYGTEILIDEHVYIAEDTGSALIGNNIIDIFVNEPKNESYYTGIYIRRLPE